MRKWCPYCQKRYGREAYWPFCSYRCQEWYKLCEAAAYVQDFKTRPVAETNPRTSKQARASLEGGKP